MRSLRELPPRPTVSRILEIGDVAPHGIDARSDPEPHSTRSSGASRPCGGSGFRSAPSSAGREMTDLGEPLPSSDGAATKSCRPHRWRPSERRSPGRVTLRYLPSRSATASKSWDTFQMPRRSCVSAATRCPASRSVRAACSASICSVTSVLVPNQRTTRRFLDRRGASGTSDNCRPDRAAGRCPPRAHRSQAFVQPPKDGRDDRMVKLLPAEAPHLLGRGAGVVVPALVVPVSPAVGSAVRRTGSCCRELAEPFLAFAQRSAGGKDRFGTLAFGDFLGNDIDADGALRAFHGVPVGDPDVVDSSCRRAGRTLDASTGSPVRMMACTSCSTCSATAGTVSRTERPMWSATGMPQISVSR